MAEDVVIEDVDSIFDCVGNEVTTALLFVTFKGVLLTGATEVVEGVAVNVVDTEVLAPSVDVKHVLVISGAETPLLSCDGDT